MGDETVRYQQTLSLTRNLMFSLCRNDGSDYNFLFPSKGNVPINYFVVVSLPPQVLHSKGPNAKINEEAAAVLTLAQAKTMLDSMDENKDGIVEVLPADWLLEERDIGVLADQAATQKTTRESISFLTPAARFLHKKAVEDHGLLMKNKKQKTKEHQDELGSTDFNQELKRARIAGSVLSYQVGSQAASNSVHELAFEDYADIAAAPNDPKNKALIDSINVCTLTSAGHKRSTHGASAMVASLTSGDKKFRATIDSLAKSFEKYVFGDASILADFLKLGGIPGRAISNVELASVLLATECASGHVLFQIFTPERRENNEIHRYYLRPDWRDHMPSSLRAIFGARIDDVVANTTIHRHESLPLNQASSSAENPLVQKALDFLHRSDEEREREYMAQIIKPLHRKEDSNKSSSSISAGNPSFSSSVSTFNRNESFSPLLTFPADEPSFSLEERVDDCSYVDVLTVKSSTLPALPFKLALSLGSEVNEHLVLQKDIQPLGLKKNDVLEATRFRREAPFRLLCKVRGNIKSIGVDHFVVSSSPPPTPSDIEEFL